MMSMIGCVMSKTTEQLEQDYRDACVRAAAYADRAARARARAAAYADRAARARAAAYADRAARARARAAFKLWQNRLKEEENNE